MSRNPGRKPEPYDLRSKTGDPHSYLWIGMIIFVGTWTFLLGILVGRGSIPILFDPKKIEVELAKRFDGAVQKKEALLKKYIDSPHPNLAFRDQLTRSESTETIHLNPPGPQAGISSPIPAVVSRPVASAHPEHRSDVITPVNPISDSAVDVEKPAIQPSVPATDRQPVSPPTPEVPAPASPAKGIMTLRANPIPSRRTAENVVGKLKSKGYDARMQTRMISGKGIWYEVMVENIQTRTEASALMAELRQENMESTVR